MAGSPDRSTRGQHALARHGRMLELPQAQPAPDSQLDAPSPMAKTRHAVAPDVAERARHQDEAFGLGLEEARGDLVGLLRLGARASPARAVSSASGIAGRRRWCSSKPLRSSSAHRRMVTLAPCVGVPSWGIQEDHQGHESKNAGRGLSLNPTRNPLWPSWPRGACLVRGDRGGRAEAAVLAGSPVFAGAVRSHDRGRPRGRCGFAGGGRPSASSRARSAFLRVFSFLPTAVEVEIRLARLGEQAAGPLLFLHVVADVFAEDLHLGVEIVVGRIARFDLGDQHLGCART